MDTATVTCKNCGAQFKGKYCNTCGEKVYHDHHKTVGHLLEEVFHFLTHFDGSFIKTIRTVFTKPGQLSLDYCNGIRKKYFKPLSLFLLCIVVYLFFSPFQGLNMKFWTFVNPKYNFAGITKPAVEKKLHSHSMTLQQLSEKFDAESPHISKLMLLVILPAMAGLLYLLFFKRSRYYFDHFILATEYGSVWIASKFILLPAIMLLITAFQPSAITFFHDDNLGLFIFIELSFIIFLSIAFKRFYQQKWVWTILKAILFLAIFELIIMYAYHVLLFFVVMLFI
jgi:hypothetical protein